MALTIFNTDRLDSDFKAVLIDALLSGEYKQGKQSLRNGENEFCCIGVACDLDPKVIWSPRYNVVEDGYTAKWHPGVGDSEDGYTAKWHPGNGNGYTSGEPYNSVCDAPAKSISAPMNQQLFDTGKNSSPFIKGVCLAKLNDDGLPFSQIADVINYFL